MYFTINHLCLRTNPTSSHSIDLLRRFTTSNPRPNNKRVVKHKVSPPREVPKHISIPNHVPFDVELAYKDPISESRICLLSREQLNVMKITCQLARRVLNFAGSLVAPGVTTDFIDAQVHQMIIKEGAYPSPLGYNNYPKSICTSINEVVAHGIPDERVLQDGDIVNVDITVYQNGYHGDCSETFLVGQSVDASAKQLVSIARECLYRGISVCGPGANFYSIGDAIEPFARKNGFFVAPIFTGHGIGKIFHDFPCVIHCTNREVGKMKPGMVFTIEPCIVEGTNNPTEPSYDEWADKWTVVCKEGCWSAQFEHTIAITQNGVEILTEYV